jgi:hypothetical protein
MINPNELTYVVVCTAGGRWGRCEMHNHGGGMPVPYDLALKCANAHIPDAEALVVHADAVQASLAFLRSDNNEQTISNYCPF